VSGEIVVAASDATPECQPKVVTSPACSIVAVDRMSVARTSEKNRFESFISVTKM
jgi:hypothetical protein